MLQTTIASEHNALLIEFVDTLAAISSIEVGYYYLCDLRDGGKYSDLQTNPLAKEPHRACGISTIF